jgi:O-antigen/teichoic acid export membrane protein
VKADLPLLHGVIRWCCIVTLLASALVVAGFFLANLILAPMTANRWAIMLWSAVALVAMVASGLVESILRAEGSHLWATIPSRLLRPLLMGGLFASLSWLVVGPLDAWWAIAVNATSVALAGVVAFMVLRPLLPCRPAEPANPPRRLWLGTSLAFGLNGLALYLNGQIDMLVLGFYHGGATLGFYGAVMRIVTVINFSSTAVIIIIQPMIVRAIAHSTHDCLQRLVMGGARLVFLASAGCAVLVFLLAEPILSIFGEGFEAGAAALRILCFGYLVSSLVSLAGALLGMGGHQRLATTVMVGGTTLTLILNLLLVPRYGAVGAAAGTATSVIIWNLALFLFAHARLGIIAAPWVAARQLRDAT